MSLAAQQYYANPRNVFWRIMADIAGFDPHADYPQRTAALVTAGIAVWDVLASCRRRGSLDSSVERDSMVANDFESFFAVRPTIGRVFFSGGAAQVNYRRLAVVSRALEYRRLPSTSPANTVGFQVKLDAWRAAFTD
jgi:hypoxanthine-DNA glycosylase